MALKSLIKANEGCGLTINDLERISKNFKGTIMLDGENPMSYLDEVLLDTETGLLVLGLPQDREVVRREIELEKGDN